MKKDKCVLGKKVVMHNTSHFLSELNGLEIASDVTMTNRVAYVKVKADNGDVHTVPISRLQDKEEFDSIMNCYVG
jgi:hypothetical protein